jgi:hypothetical protein
MRARIRPFDDRDAEAVVDLSLRTWAPVFASLERVLGSDLFGRLHPDWREDQRRAVEGVLAAKEGRVWVAEADGTAVGFVAVRLHPESGMGEIYIGLTSSWYFGRALSFRNTPQGLLHRPPARG